MSLVNRLIVVAIGLLLAGAGVDASQAQKVLPPDTVGKAVEQVKFEARCEPDSPGKMLLVVDDMKYYLIAQKGGLSMQDFGVPGNFSMAVVPVDSDRGKEIMNQIPRKYNNQIDKKITMIYSERYRRWVK